MVPVAIQERRLYHIFQFPVNQACEMHPKMFSLFDLSSNFSSSSFELRGFWKALELNDVASIYLADTKMITESEKDDVYDLLYFRDTEASSHESDNSAKEGTQCKTQSNLW